MGRVTNLRVALLGFSWDFGWDCLGIRALAILRSLPTGPRPREEPAATGRGTEIYSVPEVDEEAGLSGVEQISTPRGGCRGDRGR